MSSWKACFGALLLVSGLGCATAATFTNGMQAPESIPPAPDTFISLTGYLVVDPTNANSALDEASTIWQMSTAGVLSTFATSNYSPRDGIFLPSDFGSFGGDYAVSDFLGNAAAGASTDHAGAVVLDGSSRSPIAFFWGIGTDAVNLAIAPSGFGSIGGDVLVSYANLGPAGIAVFNSAGVGQADPLTEDVFVPFYMAFAPFGFGSDGGDLLSPTTGRRTFTRWVPTAP